jgi:hypothetical protein
MMFTKIIIIFLLIIFIIILLNKNNINEHLQNDNKINNFILNYEIEINQKIIYAKKLANIQFNNLNNYMYLPNKPNMFDQNIIWEKLEDYENKGFASTLFESNNTDISKNTFTKKSILFENKINRTTYFLSPNNYNNNKTAIEITVPPYKGNIGGVDFSVLWIRMNINEYNNIKVFRLNVDGETTTVFGRFSIGYRNLTNISPDGSASYSDIFDAWHPIPIRIDVTRKILINNPYGTDVNKWNEVIGAPNGLNIATGGSGFSMSVTKPGGMRPEDSSLLEHTLLLSQLGISGIAFSTNPWNHYRIDAHTLFLNLNKDASYFEVKSTYHDVQNGDNISFRYRSLDGDNLTLLKTGKRTFRIPFVNSRNDKIFYLIQWGADTGIIGLSLTITDTDTSNNEIFIGNLYSTLNNPFSKHFNSKKNGRYLGITIPKENFLPINEDYITITISTSTNIWLREIGTHDEFPNF